MTKIVQDVKFAIHTLVDKCSGNDEEPFSTEEIETLIFAFESHILFDPVAHKFVPSLKALLELQKVANTDTEADDSVSDHTLVDQNHLLHERSDMTKAILFSAIKEDILHDMRMRFGA